MPELARRAFREALSGRPGPVQVDVPQDVLRPSESSRTMSLRRPGEVSLHRGAAP